MFSIGGRTLPQAVSLYWGMQLIMLMRVAELRRRMGLADD